MADLELTAERLVQANKDRNNSNNGIKETSYSFFYKKHNPAELTEADGQAVLTEVLSMKMSQLAKGIYYGLELIHQVLKRNKSTGSVKFRNITMNRISEHSIAWGTQHLEMIADYDQYGGLNGILNHYYNKCRDENGELVEKAQGEFVNIALAHSYITGVHEWLAMAFVDFEEADSHLIPKLKNLVFELSQHRPEVWNEINAEREYRKSSNYASVQDTFIPNPNTVDDSDRLVINDSNDEYIKFMQEHAGKLTNAQIAAAQPQNPPTIVTKPREN